MRRQREVVRDSSIAMSHVPARHLKTAFVLSGGSSLGAIQVGMLQALMEAGVTAAETVYIGDDIIDRPVLEVAGRIIWMRGVELEPDRDVHVSVSEFATCIRLAASPNGRSGSGNSR